MPMDENHTNSDMHVSDMMVPWALVKDIIRPETAYSDPEETMTEFLIHMQTKDPGTQWLIKSKGVHLKDASSDLKWKIDSQGLLQFKSWAYVPQIEAVKSEIMKTNHDDPMGGHQGIW